jgi:hypothetical protein
MNYNSKKSDESQVKRYVMKIDVILKIVAAILKMAETWMANDISYSGTRQGTFVPNLVLVSPSEIFYQLSVSFHIYVHCTCAKIQTVVVL